MEDVETPSAVSAVAVTTAMLWMLMKETAPVGFGHLYYVDWN